MRQTSPLIPTLLFALAFCWPTATQAQSARRTGSGSRLPSASRSSAAEKPLPAGWKLYRFGENNEGWSLAFPVEPVEKTEPFKAAGGGSLVLHTFEGEARSGYYGAVYVEMASPVNQRELDERRESLYELLWKQMTGGIEESLKASGFKNVIVSPLMQRKVSVDGYEGRERDFLISPANARVRVIFTERRIYALAAVWIKEEFEEERDAFFDLFEIRPAR
jgi:hypothetical protein